MNNKLLLLVAAVVVFATYFTQKASNSIALRTPAEQQAENTGNPLIGGDFSLVTQHGDAYTQADLNGQWSLVFFGFSHCPDMCPTALTSITAALDSLPAEVADRITPVLITVDAERDTPEVLKEYAANFHPRLVALTGTPEQTAQAASAFKVYHQKANPQAEDYMVNHSGFIYVMDEQGRYLRHFSYEDSPQSIADAMQALVKQQ